MNVVYQKKFLKQLAQIPSTTRIKIEKFAFEELPVARSIAELGVIEKMQGPRLWLFSKNQTPKPELEYEHGFSIRRVYQPQFQ